MKCNPGRWAWGLIPIAMLSWIAVQAEHRRIEADLARRSQVALDKAGLNWAVASFSGRDGQLIARLSEEGQKGQALDLVAQVWGVGTVDGRVDESGVLDSYAWSAALRDEEIKLFGSVPNEETRKVIYGVVTANLPKRKIDDRMKLAEGSAPRDTWLAGISFAIKQLVALKRGSVSLDGIRFSIAGEALDPASYKSVKSALSTSMPSGIKLASDQVTPPVIAPYRWVAKLAGNQLLIAGFGPDEKQREDVFSLAKKAFPRSAIVDRMESGDGAPVGWLEATSVALDQLAQLSEGSAELRDQRMTLSGKAADEATAATVRSAFLARLPAKYDGDTEITFPKPDAPVVSPFTTSFNSTSAGVDVIGFVPSEAARKALLEAVASKFPNRNVVDRLQIAGGAPEGWQTCILAAAAGLARLDNGRAALTDKRLELTGVTRDEQVAGALQADMRAAINRACDLDMRVTLDLPEEPKLSWKARSDGEGQVVLEGQVPSGTVRAQLVEAANRYFSGAQLVDRLEVVDVASYKWGAVAETGLKQLAKLRKGEVTLTGTDLRVQGQAADSTVVTSIREQLSRNVGKGFRASEAIEVRSDAMIWAETEARRKSEQAASRAAEAESKPDVGREPVAGPPAPETAPVAPQHGETVAERPSAEAEDLARRAEAGETAKLGHVEARTCQQAMQLIAGKGSIEFDFGSAILKPESLPTLDRLVRVADACPKTRIEIKGHTDSDGDAERNERLSLRRAEAVVDYLNRAGVDSTRLSASGFGASRPLVANDSEANKAKNRRIEFVVRAN